MDPIWQFGLPPDLVCWAALGSAGLLWLAWRPCRAAVQAHPRAGAIALGLLAAGLSWGYVLVYLRGGPRIIDATSYFLEARTLAQGALGFEPLLPSASVRGRFLTGPPDGTSLSVIFPPGYPLLLALGFFIGHPMWVGPLLALALVLVTHQLALSCFQRHDVALGAAALSVVCATLRYHTADTMSHAWAALLFAFSLLGILKGGGAWALLAGLAAGWLCATRPISGALCISLCLIWLIRFGMGPRTLKFVAGLAPGALLLLAHQRVATGHWFASSQRHYYALADGPPGCFKYGFGREVGCVHEHGDVVQRSLEDGFGVVEALTTSLHRLHWHMLDVANFEPLWLLVPYAAVVGYQLKVVRLLSAACVGIVIAYAPFYFNGSYPGGGARFFADVLPLEHVLVAWALVRLSAFRGALVLALAGFGLHAGYSHRALAERDTGGPMFSAEFLERAGVRRGLVFVPTDHGFNLGFDPTKRDARNDLVVARERGDANDRLLWEGLDKPAVYRYRLTRAGEDPQLLRHPPPLDPRLVFEAESDWPLRKVQGGYAHPAHVGNPCASAGRVLQLVPQPDSTLEALLQVGTLDAGNYRLEVGWVKAGDSRLDFELRVAGVTFRGTARFDDQGCSVMEAGKLTLVAGPQDILLSVKAAPARLDFVRLIPLVTTP